jgi:FolB domain-containing protein
MTDPLDRIEIRDLRAWCILGLYDWERTEAQEVIIGIVLHADLREACRTDCIDDTVDYKAIKKRVLAAVEASSFYLVERLAEEVARICLADARVRRVDVIVDKPGALRHARSVAVEIARFAGDTEDGTDELQTC